MFLDLVLKRYCVVIFAFIFVTIESEPEKDARLRMASLRTREEVFGEDAIDVRKLVAGIVKLTEKSERS